VHAIGISHQQLGLAPIAARDRNVEADPLFGSGGKLESEQHGQEDEQPAEKGHGKPRVGTIVPWCGRNELLRVRSNRVGPAVGAIAGQTTA
jgi:hypothetical protein